MFSQGEWQLLSIARAAAADPAVLLLDEITADLDAETEARVLEALRRASEGWTVLSVSHRVYENLGGRTVEIKAQDAQTAQMCRQKYRQTISRTAGKDHCKMSVSLCGGKGFHAEKEGR